MNIYEKMLAVTEAVQNIEKIGWNEYSKYKYIRAVDVVAGVQKELVKNKIGLVISETEFTPEQRDGSKNRFAKIKCHAVFVNAEKPDEKIEVDYYAEAADTLDKSIYKAKTNGLKYLLTQQFMLVTDVMIDAEQGSPAEKEGGTTRPAQQDKKPASKKKGNIEKAIRGISDAPDAAALKRVQSMLNNYEWTFEEEQKIDDALVSKSNDLKKE